MRALKCRKLSTREVGELLASRVARVDEALAPDFGPRVWRFDDDRLLLMIGSGRGLLYPSRDEFVRRHRDLIAESAARQVLLDQPFEDPDKFISKVPDLLGEFANWLGMAAGAIAPTTDVVLEVDRRLGSKYRARKNARLSVWLTAFIGEAIRLREQGEWTICVGARHDRREPCIRGRDGRVYRPAAVFKLLVEKKRPPSISAVIEGLLA